MPQEVLSLLATVRKLRFLSWLRIKAFRCGRASLLNHESVAHCIPSQDLNSLELP